MARKRRSIWLRLLIWAGSLLLILAVVLLVKALFVGSQQMRVDAAPEIELDIEAAAERLGESLSFATISDPARFSPSAFTTLHAHLERSFPKAHARLQREVIHDYSLLYTWKGSDAEAAPLVLLAHLDVVPVDAGSAEDWTYPAFNGVVSDGFVWGRGALDDKGSVLGLLEAVEYLLDRGFEPERTIYLAFGHDEEIGGPEGAAEIARVLTERNVEPMMILDEGGAILEGMVPGVDAPVAFVGVGEKGYMSLELSVTGKGGHSSRPPAQTAIGVLSAAIVRLEDNPMPARLGEITSMTMDHLAPEMDIGPRTLMANRWLFGRGIEYGMGMLPDAAPMVRTTTAATIIEAGTKDNVLPIRARAVVNFRLAPQDTPDAVIAHVEQVIDDERVKVEPVEEPRPAAEPSAVGNDAWKLLARTIRETNPDTVVTPYLVIGGTDARHYRPLSDAVYRFKAGRVDQDTLSRAHGTDERLSIDDYAETIRFYVRLIENATGPDGKMTAG